MGLEAIVQAGIVTAFEAAGDLVGTVSLTRQTAGVHDPATGVTPQTPVVTEFDGILDESKVASNEAGGLNDEISAVIYLRPVSGVEPEVGDELLMGAKRYRAETVEPVSPNGTTVLLWEVGVSI